MLVSSGSPRRLREAIQVTVGGDASVAGRLELFGGQALAENQSSEDVLASARWRPVMLDVGGKLAVTGDTTLHGTDANVIRVGEARAVGDGRASDAGVMRIRVTGDSVIGGGLALQAGSADIMSTRSASDTAQATGQSVQYVAQGDLRVAQGITLQAGSAKVGRPGGTSGSTVSPRGRQQPSGERQPDQRWSGQRAGGHPLRGCPTRHAGIPRDRHRRARLRRRRIRLAVGGGDALYPPSGRTGRGRRARRRAARQPGRRQSLWPGHPCRWRAAQPGSDLP